MLKEITPLGQEWRARVWAPSRRYNRVRCIMTEEVVSDCPHRAAKLAARYHNASARNESAFDSFALSPVLTMSRRCISCCRVRRLRSDALDATFFRPHAATHYLAMACC